MYLLSVVLVAATAFGVASGLASPYLCPGGKGDSFVCGIMDNAKTKQSDYAVNTDEFTVAAKGQKEFFETVQSLASLTQSLGNGFGKQIENSKDRTWSRFLEQAIERLSTVNYRSVNLLYTAASSIKGFQTSVTDSTAKQQSQIADTVEKATYGLQYDSDRKLIEDYANSYKQTLKDCQSSFEGELEGLQMKSQSSVETYYDSSIKLLDQVGKCLQISSKTACVADARRKMNKLASAQGRLLADTNSFELMGQKNFDKYPCVVTAGARFQLNVRSITRTAKTTQATTASTTTAKKD